MGGLSVTTGPAAAGGVPASVPFVLTPPPAPASGGLPPVVPWEPFDLPPHPASASASAHATAIPRPNVICFSPSDPAAGDEPPPYVSSGVGRGLVPRRQPFHGAKVRSRKRRRRV